MALIHGLAGKKARPDQFTQRPKLPRAKAKPAGTIADFDEHQFMRIISS